MRVKRKYLQIFFSLLLIGAGLFALPVNGQTNALTSKTALLLDVKEAIGPATEDYIQRGLQTAATEKAVVVILQLDTPGGLDTATRGIIRDIIASPVPVITYVAPSGARAASAGTYILYASHIAAMAPGTNVGAATPVGIDVLGGDSEQQSKANAPQSTEARKTQNDALAYLRSLAQLRGRNVAWTQQAVLESASLSATEALKANVIDVIAPDVPSLLNKVNGRTINVQGETQVMHTSGLTVTSQAADWHHQFLMTITDPNIAYILFLIGVFGLFFEFFNPGFILPGVAGVIALLLALYAFQLLPINYTGLALILFGIAFLVAEAFLPSGILAAGGIAGFVLGSMMLLEPTSPGFNIALSLIISVSVITALFFLIVINLAIKARFRPIVSGREELLGSVGEVIQIKGETQLLLRLRGELWQIKSDSVLTPGQKVVVTGRQGLVLWVKPQSHKSSPPL